MGKVGNMHDMHDMMEGKTGMHSVEGIVSDLPASLGAADGTFKRFVDFR